MVHRPSQLPYFNSHTQAYTRNSTVPQPKNSLLKWSTGTQFGYKLGTAAVQSCMGVWISLCSPMFHLLRKHNKLLQMLCPLFAVWISAKDQIVIFKVFLSPLPSKPPCILTVLYLDNVTPHTNIPTSSIMTLRFQMNWKTSEQYENQVQTYHQHNEKWSQSDIPIQ
jgi:hypothetical protein